MDSSQKQDENKIKKPKHLFKPGESGNPGGRPKGSVSITNEIRKELIKIAPKELTNKQKKTYLKLLIEKIFEKAIKNGDTKMIKSIWNYMDGYPVETHDIHTDELSQMSDDALDKRIAELEALKKNKKQNG